MTKRLNFDEGQLAILLFFLAVLLDLARSLLGIDQFVGRLLICAVVGGLLLRPLARLLQGFGLPPFLALAAFFVPLGNVLAIILYVIPKNGRG